MLFSLNLYELTNCNLLILSFENDSLFLNQKEVTTGIKSLFSKFSPRAELIKTILILKEMTDMYEESNKKMQG